MPRQGGLNNKVRMGKLYRITDPLWRAIALGHTREVQILQDQLADLLRSAKPGPKPKLRVN